MRAEAEADGIDGVVRNGEAVDFDIAQRKVVPAWKQSERRVYSPQGMAGAVRRVMKIGAPGHGGRERTRPLT